jgi:predicted short-subunit dehydrogenase-like oxidoreductase (DUF2520 family)
MDNKLNISVIGPGKVGKALARVLSGNGHDVTLLGRNDAKSEFGELVFITTPDSEIIKVVQELSEMDHKGRIILHTSGTLASDHLKLLKEKGAAVGCFHPIQSVTVKTSSFEGSWFDIEGDEKAVQMMKELASVLKIKTIEVSANQKQLLHVSAVMASNYLVTLTHLATQISKESGLEAEEIKQALLPLMESSLRNLYDLSPEDALTGPIQRGDVETVSKHVKLLKSNDKLLSIYKKLGLLTLELTSHEPEVKQALSELLR